MTARLISYFIIAALWMYLGWKFIFGIVLGIALTVVYIYTEEPEW